MSTSMLHVMGCCRQSQTIPDLAGQSGRMMRTRSHLVDIQWPVRGASATCVSAFVPQRPPRVVSRFVSAQATVTPVDRLFGPEAGWFDLEISPKGLRMPACPAGLAGAFPFPCSSACRSGCSLWISIPIRSSILSSRAVDSGLPCFLCFLVSPCRRGLPSFSTTQSIVLDQLQTLSQFPPRVSGRPILESLPFAAPACSVAPS